MLDGAPSFIVAPPLACRFPHRTRKTKANAEASRVAIVSVPRCAWQAAFYTAERAWLEREQLFGKAHADKPEQEKKSTLTVSRRRRRSG
jgi:hypothetical protein